MGTRKAQPNVAAGLVAIADARALARTDPRRARFNALITMLKVLRDHPDELPPAMRERYERAAADMYKVLRGATLAGETREADLALADEIVVRAATSPLIRSLTAREARSRADWAIDELARWVDEKARRLVPGAVVERLLLYVPRRERGGLTSARIAAELLIDAGIERVTKKDGSRDEAVIRVRRYIEDARSKRRK